MGLIRKAASVSTAGLIDFRSDKERIAKNTKKAYKAQQDGNVIAAQQLAAQQAMLQAQLRARMNPPAAPIVATYVASVSLPPPTQPVQAPALASAQPTAPGWYPDPLGTSPSRWFDGERWTNDIG